MTAGNAQGPRSGTNAERMAALRTHRAKVLRLPDVVVFPVDEFPTRASKEIFHEYLVWLIVEDDAKCSRCAGCPCLYHSEAAVDHESATK